tara:strand:- start:465 stop:845 length:381 start_codon:yes stop_codon:yes gene_type:complete
MTDLFRGFGVDIAAEILKGLGPGIPQATLLSRSLGAVNAADLTAGRPIVETAYACLAFIDAYDTKRFGSSVIQEGTRVVLIIGDSLPAGVIPQDEDRITLEGTTFHITGQIQRDPAAATYVMEIRA